MDNDTVDEYAMSEQTVTAALLTLVQFTTVQREKAITREDNDKKQRSLANTDRYRKVRAQCSSILAFSGHSGKGQKCLHKTGY